MPPILHIQLLGGFRVLLDTTPVTTLDLPRLQALLAYLLLQRGMPQARQHLAFLLWPDSTEAQARSNLRSLLYRLRQALPDADRFLHIDTQHVQWRADASWTLDVADFERALTQATQGEHSENQETLQSALAQAVEQYHGELLPGWYDDWVLIERERLRQAFLAALERLISILEGMRQYTAAIGYAQHLLRGDPLYEATYQHLMRLHALSGDRASVLRIYQACTTVLERELGVEPSLTTRAAYERALHSETLAPAPVELRVAATSVAPPHNLPLALTSFVGRVQEAVDVQRLLGRTRLLTLTGAGGSGKTRLALAAAAAVVADYAGGVWLVELAAVTDPALVPHAVAATLGVHEEPQRRLTATLADALRPKVLLLVLDNCEHLVDACAYLAAELLGACPQLWILATSREPLGVAGEITWLVPSLALPDLHHILELEALRHGEAVQLFVERAAAALPTFALTQANVATVVQICRRLDGLPLAIELAAARVKILAVEQIAARLDDCFRLLTGGSRTALPRQQAMRAAIDWSYALLSEPERALFRRLAVFAGGWTLDAAEVVCTGEGVAADDVLESLAHLVDKSLVIVQPQSGQAVRYRLLEPVRQYAYEKLRETDEAATIQEQHTTFFLELAEVAAAKLRGGQQSLWFDRLELEQDNLQTALIWGREAASGDINLRLAGALWWFWFVRGHLSEARRWLEDALARSNGASALLRARALSWAGFLAWFGDEDTQAAALLLESRALSQKLGDTWSLVWSLATLGSIAYEQEDLMQATALLRESLKLSRGLGDTWPVAWSLATLGLIAHGQEDYAQATGLLEESLALSRESGDQWIVAWSLGGLGHSALDQGNIARAIACFEESLAMRNVLGDRRGRAYSLDDLGRAALAQGDYTRASALMGESLALLRELSASNDFIYRLEGLAEVAIAQGQPLRAARLCAAIEGVCEANGVALEPRYRVKYERCVVAIHDQLDTTTVAAAWADGRALTVEQAIAEALRLATGQIPELPLPEPLTP